MNLKKFGFIFLSGFAIAAALYGVDWMFNFMIGTTMKSPRDYLIMGGVISGVLMLLAILSEKFNLKASGVNQAMYNMRMNNSLSYYFLFMVVGLIFLYGLEWIKSYFFGFPKDEPIPFLIMNSLFLGVILYFSKYAEPATK